MDDSTKRPSEPKELSDEELGQVAGGAIPAELMPSFDKLDQATKDKASFYLTDLSDRRSVSFLIDALNAQGLTDDAKLAQKYYDEHFKPYK